MIPLRSPSPTTLMRSSGRRLRRPSYVVLEDREAGGPLLHQVKGILVLAPPPSFSSSEGEVREGRRRGGKRPIHLVRAAAAAAAAVRASLLACF